MVEQDPLGAMARPGQDGLSLPVASADGEPQERLEVFYSCLRCGTSVPNAELIRLPEIKCICGFRVFTKVRPPLVKSVDAV